RGKLRICSGFLLFTELIKNLDCHLVLSGLLKSHGQEKATLRTFETHPEPLKASDERRRQLQYVLVTTHFESKREPGVGHVSEARRRVHRVAKPSLGAV